MRCRRRATDEAAFQAPELDALPRRNARGVARFPDAPSPLRHWCRQARRHAIRRADRDRPFGLAGAHRCAPLLLFGLQPLSRLPSPLLTGNNKTGWQDVRGQHDRRYQCEAQGPGDGLRGRHDWRSWLLWLVMDGRFFVRGCAQSQASRDGREK